MVQMHIFYCKDTNGEETMLPKSNTTKNICSVSHTYPRFRVPSFLLSLAPKPLFSIIRVGTELKSGFASSSSLVIWADGGCWFGSDGHVCLRLLISSSLGRNLSFSQGSSV